MSPPGGKETKMLFSPHATSSLPPPPSPPPPSRASHLIRAWACDCFLPNAGDSPFACAGGWILGLCALEENQHLFAVARAACPEITACQFTAPCRSDKSPHSSISGHLPGSLWACCLFLPGSVLPVSSSDPFTGTEMSRLDDEILSVASPVRKSRS
jgi:hypothetical protein